MANDSTDDTNSFLQKPSDITDDTASAYILLHRELTALLLPVIHRRDVAEDLVSEFLLRELFKPGITIRPDGDIRLLEQARHYMQEEKKVFQAEQVFAREQGQQVIWPVKFHLEGRFLLLNLSSYLSEIEQRFLRASLKEELDPEEIAVLLYISPQRLRNIRDLCLIHLRKILNYRTADYR